MCVVSTSTRFALPTVESSRHCSRFTNASTVSTQIDLLLR